MKFVFYLMKLHDEMNFVKTNFVKMPALMDFVPALNIFNKYKT